jgi:hypothetical protein
MGMIDILQAWERVSGLGRGFEATSVPGLYRTHEYIKPASVMCLKASDNFSFWFRFLCSNYQIANTFTG